MRKAAAGWEEDYSRRLVEAGFTRGRAVPTAFYNRKTGVRLVVHGDDFTFSGERKELEAVRELMRGWYDIKDRGIMGSGGGEIKEVTILGRTLRWVEGGLEYEADEGHRRKIMEMEGLSERSNAAPGPAVREDGSVEVWGAEELSGGAAKEFRSGAASLNYLGLDRSDIQYAVKEICQGMSRATVGGKAKIKRVARYLAGARRLVWRFGEVEGNENEVRLKVYVDSDWASGADRKSTSGGMILADGVAVKHWSRTQKARALSSGEAEYYAIVSGSAEGLGLAPLPPDYPYTPLPPTSTPCLPPKPPNPIPQHYPTL
jgi:hypothetical protein